MPNQCFNNCCSFDKVEQSSSHPQLPCEFVNFATLIDHFQNGMTTIDGKNKNRETTVTFTSSFTLIWSAIHTYIVFIWKKKWRHLLIPFMRHHSLHCCSAFSGAFLFSAFPFPLFPSSSLCIWSSVDLFVFPLMPIFWRSCPDTAACSQLVRNSPSLSMPSWCRNSQPPPVTGWRCSALSQVRLPRFDFLPMDRPKWGDAAFPPAGNFEADVLARVGVWRWRSLSWRASFRSI